MEKYIENLCSLIKKSNLSKSEKINTQLFIKVCLYNDFLKVGSNYIFLSKIDANYFLNNKYDFALFGREKVIDYNPVNTPKKIFSISCKR